MFKTKQQQQTQKRVSSSSSLQGVNSEASKIMNIISSKSSPLTSTFSFQTHHVQYCYPLSINKKNQYTPTVKITKLHEKKPSLICTQDEVKQIPNNEQILNVLNDIFNEKLNTKYNGNVYEYKKNEKERHSIKVESSMEGIDLQLFDDVPMESVNEQDEELKKKALQDLMDEGVDTIMDQYKLPKISMFGEDYSSSDEESKTSKKFKKKRTKEFAFLEDSDEEIEENLSKEIAVAGEEESEDETNVADEEFLKSKAQETQGYIKYSKLKKEKATTVHPGSKKRKANAEWDKIKNMMKEKEEKKNEEQNKSNINED
ncbi:hypothetical protein C9374_007729 [Naegleria lovaniensis]|uniref:Uncharacterized protein n=1 Tax=Naegleria lovaniensis TaxID=51637 RepID=A0AA88KIC5_NAELO|nr:uncharacterized protein C9374_007729 [Naegleria lovaniensis]KAG2379091.1 hypothetical protein C9374_007729 [Naegleria lovaniensis]